MFVFFFVFVEDEDEFEFEFKKKAKHENGVFHGELSNTPLFLNTSFSGVSMIWEVFGLLGQLDKLLVTFKIDMGFAHFGGALPTNQAIKYGICKLFKLWMLRNLVHDLDS